MAKLLLYILEVSNMRLSTRWQNTAVYYTELTDTNIPFPYTVKIRNYEYFQQ